MLSTLDNPPKAPLIISSRFFEELFAHQKISKMNELNIEKIYDLMKVIGTSESLCHLYEVLIIKYMTEGLWDETVANIRIWN